VEVLFVALFFYGLAIFALFWLVRLGVRYGVDDALRKNRHWLGREFANSPDAEQP